MTCWFGAVPVMWRRSRFVEVGAWPWAAVLFAASASVLAAAVSSDFDAYCMHNTPSIPALSAESSDLFSVRQVQVFIRHGARTRCLGGADSCWRGDENTVYNCTNQVTMGSVLDGKVRFAKTYERGKNVLKGDCMMGQLTHIGYEQQRRNGYVLRDAYGGSSRTTSTVGKNVLLDDSLFTSSEDIDEIVHLRSDDESRTLQSGQALVSSLFSLDGLPPSVDGMVQLSWSTRDSEKDTISPNANVCPMLSRAYEKLHESPPWVRLQNATAAPLLRKLAPILGVEESKIDLETLFDCFWTHYCPDAGEIPEGLIEGKEGSRLIDDVVAYVSKIVGLTFTNPEVAKYGAGPLLGEVIDSMVMAAGLSPRAKRFALYSGHDTGPMMPLLGALGVFREPYQFTPYASLLSIELLERLGANGTLYVRVVYNGQIMKVGFPECGPEEGGDWMCPWVAFRKRVQLLVPSSEACRLPKPVPPARPHGSANFWEKPTTTILFVSIALALLLGLAVGSGVTWMLRKPSAEYIDEINMYRAQLLESSAGGPMGNDEERRPSLPMHENERRMY